MYIIRPFSRGEKVKQLLIFSNIQNLCRYILNDSYEDNKFVSLEDLLVLYTVYRVEAPDPTDSSETESNKKLGVRQKETLLREHNINIDVTPEQYKMNPGLLTLLPQAA